MRPSEDFETFSFSIVHFPFVIARNHVARGNDQ
jgi:hypothetical protein